MPQVLVVHTGEVGLDLLVVHIGEAAGLDRLEANAASSSKCRKLCHRKNLKCNMSNVTGYSSHKLCPKKGHFEVTEPIEASQVYI